MTAFIVQHTVRHIDIANALVVDPLKPKEDWLTVAEDFGVIHVLFSNTPNGYDTTTVNAYAKNVLAKYDEVDDCIVAMGSPFLIGVAMVWAAHATHGNVNVLEWDKRAGGYHERELTMFGGDVDEAKPF
jgi:hypothetical protein